MVIVRILGGLGNQLFQYAAALSLAELHGTILKVDISGFRDYQLRNFDLQEFALPLTIASEQEIDKWNAKGSLQRLQSYLTPYSKRTFYKQPYFHFDKNFHRLGSDVYLQGYFQSEKYFQPIQKVVRNTFQLKDAQIEKVKLLGASLKMQSSVALHIRRGDYKNEEALRYHGILPISYYQLAIAHMQKHLDNAQFFIFSDDSQWVKENLQIENAIIVSGQLSHTHFEDLYLMSQCRHNIIANSSFSWWGAWLNNNTDKIVIAPKQWFNEGPKDTEDLYPSTWIKL